MAGGRERGWVVEHFAGLVDPRAERAKRHELLDIIVITICGVICGADNWVEIEEFGNARLEWLSRFLRLPNGIPSHDTFGRVFSRLDPDQFGACFMTWVRSVAELTQGEVVAIDGKTLRRCHDRGQGRAPLHLVSAWAAQNHLVLGQTRTQAHSNEITAIPQLLALLELRGCIITIDAMGCQTEIAQQIVDGGADYLLAVKSNQGELYGNIQDLFQMAAQEGAAQEGSAQEGSAQEGSAQEGSAQEGSAQEGSAQEGSAQEGSAQEGSAQEGSAQEGQEGSAQEGSAQRSG